MEATLGVPLLASEVQRIRVYTVGTGSTEGLPVAESHIRDRLAIRTGHIASGTLSTKPVRVIEICCAVIVRRQVPAVGKDFSAVPSAGGA